MNQPIEKHFVTFLSPGSFFDETSTRPIESWDTELACAMSRTIVERYDATPYAFYFETRLVAEPVPDGRGGTLEVRHKELRTSALHYLGGRLETLDDVEARNDPNERILRSNMRSEPIVCVTTNGWKHTGPFKEADVVVDEQGRIVERGDTAERIAYRKKFVAVR